MIEIPLCCFQLITARSVAEQLDVSSETVLRWTRKGKVPAVKLPSGQIRYDEDELAAWIKSRATPRSGVLTATDDAAQAVSSGC